MTQAVMKITGLSRSVPEGRLQSVIVILLPLHGVAGQAGNGMGVSVLTGAMIISISDRQPL